ncbi:ABC transporter substrate-binding protein [Paraburkholderia sp.]|uniref:ABC transporter substrate-binding protein n=1 Tax=Paraburkholderia sp. TaxID=1926495 RepID=UPI0039E6DEE3
MNDQSNSRRTFVKGALLSVAAPALIIPRRTRAATPLVIATWGGLATKATRVAWAEPFTAATGIPVTIADGPDLAKMKAQVQGGNPGWDLVDLPGAMAVTAAHAGLLERVDPNIVDQSGLVIASPSPYLVRMSTFAGGVGWDSKRYAAGSHPTNVQEYFDFKRFPGARTLRSRIAETLELALVGSGVEPSKLYPLDVDRGFAMLDKIKPNIRKWVGETPQLTALLQTGEVDFGYVYNSRVREAQRAGIPLDMSLSQCVIGSEYLGVVRNSRNRDAAMRFINFALNPVRQANFAYYITAIPNAKGALELVDPSARRWMPDINDKQHIFISDTYWADHYEKLNARFSEWLLD